MFIYNFFLHGFRTSLSGISIITLGKLWNHFTSVISLSLPPPLFPGTTIMCLLHLLKSLIVLECPASLLFSISFSVHISIWQILLIYFQTPLFPKLSVFNLSVGLSKVYIF